MTVKVYGKCLSQVFDANKQRTELSSIVKTVRPQFRNTGRTLSRTTSSNEALVVAKVVVNIRKLIKKQKQQ
jgi:hypothetical protein